MSSVPASSTILMLDDEIYNLTWMMDYLYSKGFDILPVSSANDAVEALESSKYRAAIIDLNVPLLPPLDAAAAGLGEVYARYPGLYVARLARTKGHRTRQVIIYSVHRDEQVTLEAAKLGCTYILKGRPREIKEELDYVLAFDPSV